MSFLSNFNDNPYRPRPAGWNPERSSDRFSYRIYTVKPDYRPLRRRLIIASAVGVLVLFLLMYNKLSQPHSLAQQTEDMATLPVVTATPVNIQPVTAGESWGVISSSEAQVYILPTEFSFPLQKLSRWTLVAFDSKTDTGWYLLLGGNGWLHDVNLKTYPSQEAANSAITQGRNQAATFLRSLPGTGPGTDQPPAK